MPIDPECSEMENYKNKKLVVVDLPSKILLFFVIFFVSKKKIDPPPYASAQNDFFTCSIIGPISRKNTLVSSYIYI